MPGRALSFCLLTARLNSTRSARLCLGGEWGRLLGWDGLDAAFGGLGMTVIDLSWAWPGCQSSRLENGVGSTVKDDPGGPILVAGAGKDDGMIPGQPGDVLGQDQPAAQPADELGRGLVAAAKDDLGRQAGQHSFGLLPGRIEVVELGNRVGGGQDGDAPAGMTDQCVETAEVRQVLQDQTHGQGASRGGTSGGHRARAARA